MPSPIHFPLFSLTDSCGTRRDRRWWWWRGHKCTPLIIIVICSCFVGTTCRGADIRRATAGWIPLQRILFNFAQHLFML